MGTEDSAEVPAPGNADCKSKIDGTHDLGCEPCNSDSQPINSDIKVEEDQLKLNTSLTVDGEVGKEISQLLPATELDMEVDMDICHSPPVQQIGADFIGTTENGFLNVTDESPIGKRKRDDCTETHDSSISVVKKARMADHEQKSQVHVNYSSLTRKSREKLDQLLQQWSEWHSQNCSSIDDSNERVESGEKTYFPALRVGVENPLPVAFWIDSQVRNGDIREFAALDSKTAPVYDRGSLLEGDLEKSDAFRCFNCGSYSHTLKECTKPRDNVAVNNARKLHQSKSTTKSPSFRIPTRYYQNTPGGKYDGLTPGVLHADTRQVLGLGELDPPPWLHRMREIGYPPGYLDRENDDQPSGITIFADEEEKENDEKKSETDQPRPSWKMSVLFPGINAPIPKNADNSKWAKPSLLNLSSNGPIPRPNIMPQTNNLGQYHDQRWNRDVLLPPGCDSAISPMPFSFSPRYGNYNNGGYNSPSNTSAFTIQGNSTFERDPLLYGGSPYPTSYIQQSPRHNGSLFSPLNNGMFSYERRY